MSVFHDEIEIEDFEYDEDEQTYYFPCPCGDKFAITRVRKQTSIRFELKVDLIGFPDHETDKTGSTADSSISDQDDFVC